MLSVLAWVLGAVLAMVAGPEDGPARLDPAARTEAKPHQVYAWTSSVALLDEQGKPTGEKLRYSYVLPEGLTADSPRDLIVICHGTGLDYRWGAANHNPATFRTSDIVVSVDGPTRGQQNTRLFLGRDEDVTAFAAFLLEMRRKFPVRLVFLYGHSQGSFFVTHFAGANDDMIDGVVAQASGMWTWTDAKAIADAALPIVFMHGTNDPVVPYGQSLGARDALVKFGHPCVRVRRLDGYIHWPNAVRTSECIDWLQGMTTKDGTEAVDAARRIWRAKPKDQYEFQSVSPLGLAADVLRRVTGDGVKPIKDVPEATKRRAADALAAIEAECAKQVTALREAGVKKQEDLKLAGDCAWLGQLLALREDARGLKSVEDYIKEIGCDELAAQHARAARPLYEAWYDDQPPAQIFAVCVATLPKCFLVDGLPADLTSKLTEWYNKADELKIAESDLAKWATVVAYREGIKNGREAYRRVWESAGAREQASER